MSILKLLEELNSLVDPAEKENKLEAIASIMFNEGANLLALGIEIDENESEDGAVRFTYPEMYLDVVMIGGEKPDVYTVKMIRKTVCDAIVYALGLEMIAANDFNAELLEATANAVEEFQRIFNLPVSGIVDYPTWYKISQIYVGVTKIAE